jgi:hypothetical protein
MAQDLKVSVDLSMDELVKWLEEFGNIAWKALLGFGLKQFTSLPHLTTFPKPLLHGIVGKASKLVVLGGGGTNVIVACNLPSPLSIYLKLDVNSPLTKLLSVVQFLLSLFPPFPPFCGRLLPFRALELNEMSDIADRSEEEVRSCLF